MNKLSKNTLYFIKAGSNYALDYPTQIDPVLLNKEIEYISTDSSSVGLEFIKNSSIQFLDFLLRNNIPNNNIFLLTDSADINRPCLKVPSSFNQEYYDNLEIQKKIYFRNIDETEIFYINFFTHGIVDLNGQIYDCGFLENEPWISDSLKEIIYEFNRNTQKESLKSKVENYLFNLLELQNYLVDNNINYNIFPTQNLFQGWIVNDDITHLYRSSLGYELPNFGNSDSITSVSQKCKELFLNLNLDAFSFHITNDDNIYGGVNEFTLDNFDLKDWSNWSDIDLSTSFILSQHPRQYVRNEYFKIYIKDRYIDFCKKNNHI